MHSKAVILNLRIARKEDFSDELGRKKFGCMYFEQSYNGTFCNQPFFFHENTNIEVFRELFKTKQIWVLAGIFDEVQFINKRKPILSNDRHKKRKVKTKRPCFCKQRSCKH